MSNAPSWAPECRVTPEMVRALIDDQFCALAPCTVEPLGFGWDNTAFLVNGDPALDLSIAYSFLPRSAQAEFRSAYGTIDEATWRLARFRALQYGTYLVPYGHEIGDHDLVREALWILHNILE